MTKTHFIQVILPLKLEWEPVYSVDEELHGMDGKTLSEGRRVRVDFAGKEYVAVISNADASKEASGMNPSVIKPIVSIADGLKAVSKQEISLWRQVAGYYLCTVGEVYKAAYPAMKVADEEAQAKSRRKRKTAGKDVTETAAAEISLSPQQTEAYSEIKKILKAGKPALLHGVTGSGKTEIYLKLAQEVLATGRNVLYLVPEIALSRQLEERLQGVFPEELRVFHSAETTAGRRETANHIRNHAYIVLGTRSSLFLPHTELGLVIVDEEHDSSYKQDSPAPRYNGRETAIMLARIFGAGIVLGSATPSLESIYNCSVGRFGLVRLDKRFYDAAESDVEVIDTIAERKKNGMVGHFSRKLISHIKDRLSKGEQVILLRERRAYSPVVQCESCGDIPKCKHCNVTLSLHRRKDGSEKMVCHYCGKVYEYTAVCGKCGGVQKPIGAGTQKIEEEARELFPEARIARLDSDSAQSKSYGKEVIKSFSKGETDILIGTQMVTKGFDFSGLTLVAVIQADSILGQEDFRADERGLQMLEQFRGRCGRRGEKGLFVIQTSQPEHPVYQAISGTIEESSLQMGLLEERKVFEYPPYSRVINVIAKDYNLQRLEYLSRDLSESLRRSGVSASVKVIGPYAPAVDRIANQHIRLIRILLPKDRLLAGNKAALAKAAADFEKSRKYHGHLALDVDPV